MRFLPKEDVTKKIVTKNKKKQIEYSLHDKFMTQKLITLLTEGLYDNPHYAAFREILTNAIEANQVNNQPKDKLVITLDSQHFMIRDYGHGLTEEDVFKVFCSFFYSTKDETNDFIGGFGLGAKAPFAVNDHFFVTSYKDGVETTYKIYLDYDQSLIRYEIMDQKQTDEPNGCCVHVNFKTPFTDNYRTRVSLGLLFMALDLNPYKYNIQVPFECIFIPVLRYDENDRYKAYFSLYPRITYFKGSTFITNWWTVEKSNYVFFSMDVEDVTIPASRDTLQVPHELDRHIEQRRQTLVREFNVIIPSYEVGRGTNTSYTIFEVFTENRESICIVYLPKRVEHLSQTTIRKKIREIFRNKYKANCKTKTFLIFTESEIQPLLDYLGLTFNELFSDFPYKIDLDKDSHLIARNKRINSDLIDKIRNLISKGYYVAIVECNGNRVIKSFKTRIEYEKFMNTFGLFAQTGKITYAQLKNRKPSKKFSILVPYRQHLETTYYDTVFLSRHKEILKKLNGIYYRRALFYQHVNKDLLYQSPPIYDVDDDILSKFSKLKKPMVLEITPLTSLTWSLSYYGKKALSIVKKFIVYPDRRFEVLEFREGYK